MNRPNEFRAWDRERKKFWYFGLFDLDQGYHFGAEEAISEMPISEFTGLFDKNGKKIWDGDVVKWFWMEEKISEVVFDKGAFSLKGWVHDTFHRDSIKTSLEVLGNVYENPELLEAL